MLLFLSIVFLFAIDDLLYFGAMVVVVVVLVLVFWLEGVSLKDFD
jgi:hypothetical protein